MTVAIARICAVLALLLGIALGVQTCRLNKEHDAALKERAAAQDAALLASGWKETAGASQRELARVVPSLKREIEALKEVNASLIAAGQWSGHGGSVDVPCTVVMGPQADTLSPHSTAPLVEPGAPPVSITDPSLPSSPAITVAVTPHVLIHDAIAIDDAGAIFVARKVQTRLWANNRWANDWTEVKPDPSNKPVSVNPDLEAAWKAWRNPPAKVAFVRSPKQWRFGLACGIGLGYGVVAQGLDVTAACVYGVEF